METEIMKIAGKLQTIPPFSACPPKELARLIPSITLKELKEGEYLFRSGSPAGELYLVREGLIKLVSGNQTVDEVAGGFVGEEITAGAEYYVSDAVAASPSVVLSLPRRALEGFLDNPGVKSNFMLSFFNHYFRGNPARSPAGPVTGPVGIPGAGTVPGWIAAFLAPSLIMFFGSGAGLDLNGRLFLSAFSVAVVMWVFRLSPADFIPCILALLSTLFLGLAPPQVALSGFASGSFFMALSVFGLGAVLVSSGISYRVILLTLKYIPKSRFCCAFSIFFTGLLLTPLVPTPSGRVSIVSPLLQDMSEALGYKPGSREANNLSAAAHTGVTFFSTSFLSGSAYNFLIFGLLPLQVREQFTWEYWTMAAAVTGAVMSGFYVSVMALVYRRGSSPGWSRERVTAQLQVLGPLNPKEWAAIAGIVLFVLGLATSSIHKVDTPWVGLAVLYLFLALGIFGREEFQKDINWPFLIYLGGLISLVNTMSYVGLDRWVGSHLHWMTGYMNDSFPLFVLLLCLGVVTVEILIPYGTTVAVFAAVFIPMAQASGINPWLIGFIIVFMADGWFFPYQSSTYMFFRELANRRPLFNERSLLSFNALTVIVRLAAVFASMPYWKMLGLY
ncbi:MAG: anion permease [Peptococcaceae bacterium]|nr:anion permease [Peptococcaceae bacterium]